MDSLVGGVGDDDVVVDARTNGSGTVEPTRLFTRTAVPKYYQWDIMIFTHKWSDEAALCSEPTEFSMHL